MQMVAKASDTLTLQDPPDLSGTISVSSAISCNSICDGQLTFNVDAVLTGTPIYQYSLDGGAYQNSSTFGGLCGDIDYAITSSRFKWMYLYRFTISYPTRFIRCLCKCGKQL